MTTDLQDFKARLPVADIVRRYVRLTRNGPLWRGLCPFHQEKSPSFTVTEQRGTYHCFGCGAHGNALDFLMAIEGLDFPAAVTRAAELTGLEPPRSRAPDPERDRILGLSDILEHAAALFKAALGTREGANAAAYLERRGVDGGAVQQFELGYAPPGRRRLTQVLEARGVSLDDLRDAGVTIIPEDGGAPYDRFRDRLMFPIRDARGRLVGFGGRSLDGSAAAKYLNSPEGPAFKKRELLYGAHRLDRRRSRGTLHVVEGYMDVIALAQHGVAAVAPLGTAITDEQLQQLWRLEAEPLVCLDGDAAGARAAGRLAERALSQLRPGLTLRFALLPAGDDPDSLIRARGAEGLASITGEAATLVDALWRHLTGDGDVTDPDGRALLRRRVRELVASIQDRDVRQEYADALFARLRTDRPAPRRSGARGGGRSIAASDVDMAVKAQECALLGTLIDDPELLEAGHAILEGAPFRSLECQQVADALVHFMINDEAPTPRAIDAFFAGDAAAPAYAALRAELERLEQRRFPVRATALKLLGLAADETGAPWTDDAAAEAARARATGSPFARAYESILTAAKERITDPD